MKKNIYLTGFMGAGKSRIGRELSRYLNCAHVDLDDEIVKSAGKSIKAIFQSEGEAYFRLLERRSLHNTRFLTTSIISTGGGAPCFFNNMEWINQNGLAIFLDASNEVLVHRLWKGRQKRPLIMSVGKKQLPHFIEQKIAERRPYYELAGVNYKIDDPDKDGAKELYQQLNYIIGH
ncbi:MAG: shikimate kinase [Bacteroidota bacterium]